MLLSAPSAGAALKCGTLPEFAKLFLRSHVQHNQLTDEVERRRTGCCT